MVEVFGCGWIFIVYMYWLLMQFGLFYLNLLYYNLLIKFSGSLISDVKFFDSLLILIYDLWMQKMGFMIVIFYIGDERFNIFYLIFMVIYIGLLVSNVLNCVMDYFGSW